MRLALALAVVLAGSNIPVEMQNLERTISTGSRAEVDRAVSRIQFLGLPRGTLIHLMREARGDAEGSRTNATYALSILHPPEAAGLFVELLDEDDATLRFSACQGLGHLKPVKAGAGPVAARLGDKVSGVRRECARTAGLWKERSSESALTAALKAETDSDARMAEVEALGLAGTTASAPTLEVLLASPDPELRLASARSLAQLGAASGRKAVEAWAASAEVDNRLAAAQVLAQLADKWSTDDLAALLPDASATVSVKASKALIDRKDPRGLKNLVVRAEKAQGDDKFEFEAVLMEMKVPQQQRLDILQAAGAVK